MKRGALMLLAAFAAGCTTVQYTTVYNGVKVDNGRTPIATVEIENSGWFLFGFIPIASGNPEKPDQCSCRLFSNTVKLENNYRVLERKTKEAGADSIANLTSHWTDESAFVILLKRRACHTSAVLLKPESIE
jgi:hypothetical protein